MSSLNRPACHVVDGPPSEMVPGLSIAELLVRLDQILQPYLVPLATNGPTPGIVFSELVDVDKFTRKDETDQSALGWVSKRAKTMALSVSVYSRSYGLEAL